MVRPTKVATLAGGWSAPGRAGSVTASPDAVVNPTAPGMARLILPFALSVVVVVLVVGIAIGTSVHEADPRAPTVAAIYSVPKTT